MKKNYKESYMTGFENEFRNILIFKKNMKIVGVAKICFSCSKSHIVGSKYHTEEFGMDGDYEKLKTILAK